MLDPDIFKLKETQLIGRAAHKAMASVSSDRYFEPDVDATKAGVILLLYPKGIEWNVVFIKRTSNHNSDKHAGQIGFPGGKYEPKDQTMANCALRELREEIGIDPQKISILKSLTPLYVFVSKFMVYPFIGVMDESPVFIREQAEVQEIIEVPLSHLFDPKIRRQKDIHTHGITLEKVPYFDLYGHVLWGATAMITEEFIQMLAQIKRAHR